MRKMPQGKPRCFQEGKGNLGCLFGLLLLGSLAFGAYKFAPPYISHYQLKDAMKEIATQSAMGVLPVKRGNASRSSGTATEVQDLVWTKAKELEIPLDKQAIKVRQEGDVVFISVSYVVPLDLIFRVYDYRFDFTVHN